jgi:anti-sigma B factor antagonist
MTQPPAQLLVMAGKQFACVKISGRANFVSSIDFKTLLAELSQRGYKYFVLDLTDCVLMDSTFLGVLAGFGLKMPVSQEAPCGPGIELLNPNARLSELLDNLGVLHLFRVTQGSLSIPEPTESQAPAPCNPSKEEVTRACLEAHQTLMSLDPRNVARFKDVAAFLAEDLKRLGATDKSHES